MLCANGKARGRPWSSSLSRLFAYSAQNEQSFQAIVNKGSSGHLSSLIIDPRSRRGAEWQPRRPQIAGQFRFPKPLPQLGGHMIVSCNSLPFPALSPAQTDLLLSRSWSRSRARAGLRCRADPTREWHREYVSSSRAKCLRSPWNSVHVPLESTFTLTWKPCSP